MIKIQLLLVSCSSYLNCPLLFLLHFRLITRQLAKYHAIHAHNGWVPQSDLWLKLGKYFALIPKYFKDPEQNAR